MTDKQWTDIKNGNFDDIYVGDYWAIGNVRYVIVDINYFFGVGNSEGSSLYKVNKNHLVIMPRSGLFSNEAFAMIDEDHKLGGYYNAPIRKNVLVDRVLPLISSAFGLEHILGLRRLFCNAVSSDGIGVGNIWATTRVDLPSSEMMFGYTNIERNIHGETSDQFALFKMVPQFIYQQYASIWTCTPGQSGGR